jgi:hypothetical protein
MKKLTISLCLLLTVKLHASSMADSFDFGPRGLAMAGAVSAICNDYTCGFYNIAGFLHPSLPSQDGDEEEQPRFSMLGSGFTYIISDISISVNSHSYTSAPSSSVLSTSNANAQSTVEQLNFGNLTTGFAFDLDNLVNTFGIPVVLAGSIMIREDGTIAAANDMSGTAFSFIQHGREVQRLMLNMGLAVQPFNNKILGGLSIGAGVTGLAGGQGSFQLGDITVQQGVSGEVIQPNADVQLDLEPAIAPIFGMQYRYSLFGFDAMIGAAYSHELKMELGPLNAQGALTLGSLFNSSLNMQMYTLDFYTPPKINLGVAIDTPFGALVSFDYQIQQWSKYQRSVGRMANEPVSPGFGDTQTIKVGAEYRVPFIPVIDVTARAGLALQNAMTADQIGIYNYLDNDKTKVGGGLSLFIPQNFLVRVPTQIDVGVQYQIWTERETIKSVKAESSSDKNYVNYTYGGNVLIFSVGATWRM